MGNQKFTLTWQSKNITSTQFGSTPQSHRIESSEKLLRLRRDDSNIKESAE